MNDLRQAAEMALERLESHDYWMDEEAIQALRQALAPEVTPEVTPEVPCKTHPDAPHGFDRNASHSADRYVCECEGWEPVDNAYTKNDTTAGVLHKENT
jgi:dienelactone hydrolase